MTKITIMKLLHPMHYMICHSAKD